MEELINKANKLVDLLEELKVSQEAERHRYVLKFEYNLGSEKVFSLYDNELKKVLIIDRAERIVSYAKLRNITEDKIY